MVAVEAGSRGIPPFIQAGTFHYFRLPYPVLWRPHLERLRMSGYNAVLLPTPWAYHSPASGFYDFTGPRNLPQLLDALEAAGLWLLLDPGPWHGLDLDAGGLPPWLLPLNFGPAGRLWRPLREWWGHLLPLVQERANLAALALRSPPGAPPDLLEGLTELVHHFLPQVPVLPLAHVPWDAVPSPRLTSAALVEADSGPLPTWGGEARAQLRRRLEPEHPRPLVGSWFGQGARAFVLSPFGSGFTWGFWRAPEAATFYGIGAPLREGGAPGATYRRTRSLALTLETLAPVLVAARPTTAPEASDPALLDAAWSDGQTTVVFLRAAPFAGGETDLSLPAAEGRLTTPPLPVPAGAVRILPLRWPLAGGLLHYTTLEPLLQTSVARRRLLVLINEVGGELLLSRNFRPRHVRGPVHVQSRDAGLAVNFDPARIASLLLNGPEGPLQLLALAPEFAARVWPLDDEPHSTPLPPPAWLPDPEEPARGLVIGPDLTVPRADGGYTALVASRGFGYRWGPWRGSDPQTWLAPISWAPPVRVPSPDLEPWISRPALVEADPDLDDGDWQIVPGAGPLQMEAHGIYRGFAWYRGRFSGPASAVTLTFRHACDLFFNGVHLASLDAPPDDLEGDPIPQTLPLPARLLREENLLAVLTESLGRSSHPRTAAQGHGLLYAVLDSDAPIAWRVRAGLTGEYTVQGFPGYADWTLVPEEGEPHLTWHRTTFDWSPPADLEVSLFFFLEQIPVKALIYLNGQLLGIYWETRGPQQRFWLPEGGLRRGRNELLIAQWTRGAAPEIGQAWLEVGPAYAVLHE
ncbi:MAG: beta-galactosidase [Anaerolineales bacterium]